MKLTLVQLTTLALMLLAGQQSLAAPTKQARLVEPKRLRDDIKRRDLLRGTQKLQDFAYSSPGRNRVFGSEGHRKSIDWIASELRALGTYDVSLQPFTATYAEHQAEVSIDGSKIAKPATFTYSPNGEFKSTQVVQVNNLGCDQADFSASVESKIALVKRGTCSFAVKVARAGAAKAAAVLLYNNAPGAVAGTLGGVGPGPEGPFVPVAGLTQEEGEKVVADIAAGKTVLADMNLTGVVENRTTYNVIAETKAGSKEQVIMLGSHSDSVTTGPGINDNGSGSIALLTIAKNFAKYSTKNAVRFAWWSAEEFGLLGSEYYTSVLTPEQKDQIRAYINFDMIASPNYFLGIHDGDGSKFGKAGPAGSAELEHNFAAYFKDIAKKPTIESQFSGRSDYGPFLDVGIAAGGLDTGAEGIKTPEEAALFGGQAGVAYDVNYHQKGDTVDNLDMEAFEINAKAISHAVATYALSFDRLGPKAARVERRKDTHDAPASKVGKHSNHRCGGDLALL